MKDIGSLAGRETVCILTDMGQPVGRNVGNSLEIIESIECLKGNMPEDIEEIILELGSYMIKLAGYGDDLKENKEKILEAIQSGKALNKFIKLVEAQDGDGDYIKDTNKFEQAKYILPVVSSSNGYVKMLDGEKVGQVSVNLGGGRIKKEDDIDHAVRNSI